MSLYLLDTDIVSLFQHGHPAVYAAVARHAAADVGITVLTVEEQLSGWYTELRRAKTSQILAAVYQRMTDTVRFYAHMNIASYTEAAIARYEDLHSQKLQVRKSDLRIAAIVLAKDAVLVTRNLQDFGKIPGLMIEDWSK
jgi:tRNA(fMet)-specific endonuclease VapC